MNLPESHFKMLRLARLRALEILPCADGFTVSSYTHRHLHYHITSEDSCPCPATDYCSHLALANHTRLRDDADYREAWREFCVAEGVKLYERERRPERRAALKAFDAVHPSTEKLFGMVVDRATVEAR